MAGTCPLTDFLFNCKSQVFTCIGCLSCARPFARGLLRHKTPTPRQCGQEPTPRVTVESIEDPAGGHSPVGPPRAGRRSQVGTPATPPFSLTPTEANTFLSQIRGKVLGAVVGNLGSEGQNYLVQSCAGHLVPVQLGTPLSPLSLCFLVCKIDV